MTGEDAEFGPCQFCEQEVMFARSTRTHLPLALEKQPGMGGTHKLRNDPEQGHQRVNGLWLVEALTPRQRAVVNQARLYKPHRDACPKQPNYADWRTKGRS